MFIHEYSCAIEMEIVFFHVIIWFIRCVIRYVDDMTNYVQTSTCIIKHYHRSRSLKPYPKLL